jgi:hypothetical protein
MTGIFVAVPSNTSFPLSFTLGPAERTDLYDHFCHVFQAKVHHPCAEPDILRRLERQLAPENKCEITFSEDQIYIADPALWSEISFLIRTPETMPRTRNGFERINGYLNEQVPRRNILGD